MEFVVDFVVDVIGNGVDGVGFCCFRLGVVGGWVVGGVVGYGFWYSVGDLVYLDYSYCVGWSWEWWWFVGSDNLIVDCGGCGGGWCSVWCEWGVWCVFCCDDVLLVVVLIIFIGLCIYWSDRGYSKVVWWVGDSVIV